MKTLILKIAFVVTFTIPTILLAQSPADQLFDKYSGEEGFTSVYITQHMFSLFADVETEEDEEGFVELVKNLKCIKIVAVDEESKDLNSGINFYDEIMKELPADQYEELMVVKKKDQDIKFLIHKEDKIIMELLMIVGGVEDNALISIQGDIDLKTISKLSKTMNIEGMENLEEIEENEENEE